MEKKSKTGSIKEDEKMDVKHVAVKQKHKTVVKKISGPQEVKEKPKKVSGKKQKKSRTPEQKKVFQKKKMLRALPAFRGRFGARNKRRKSKKKWLKWRYPHGIDILFENEDGAMPSIGYRTPKTFRDFHPSGLKEVLVSNPKEIMAMGDESVAVRFASGIGKKKRVEMLKKADEKKLFVLNRWKK